MNNNSIDEHIANLTETDVIKVTEYSPAQVFEDYLDQAEEKNKKLNQLGYEAGFLRAAGLVLAHGDSKTYRLLMNVYDQFIQKPIEI